VLLVASYAFYWLSSSWLMFFMVCATLCAFCAGLVIDRLNRQVGSADTGLKDEQLQVLKRRFRFRKKLTLALCALLILAFLLYFKYGYFVGTNVNAVLQVMGLGILPVESLVMPLGISFYTFQTLGYLIDVYRNRAPADRNIARFALFVSFFPQIVQGPIGRYGELARQLYEPHRFDYQRVKDGLLLTAYGLFKKLVIADRIGLFVNDVFDTTTVAHSGSLALVAALFYGMQIYCDFSGGIDISRGISRCFGIELSANFRHPYYSRSMTEFWRRWHITLGSWMRDYLFYPLMLSRASQRLSAWIRKRTRSKSLKAIPAAIATFIVFMAVGIWHGADWTWVAYGLFNAVIIGGGVMLEPTYAAFHKAIRVPDTNVFYTFFMRIRTVILLAFMRFFVRATTLTQALTMTASVFFAFDISALMDGALLEHGLGITDYVILIVGSLILLAVAILQEKGYSILGLLAERGFVVRWCVYVLIAVAIAGFSQDTQTVGVTLIYGRY
jgi:D-alanyl-lipoteichoic acid acyltransferase DltB (MBOAT superfamily)